MRLGVCLPSQCSGKDLKYMVDRFAKPLKINTKVSACAVEKAVTFTNLQLSIICVLSVLGLLLLSATILELWLIFLHGGSKKDVENPLCLQLLLSFSAVSNTSTLLALPAKETEAHRLRCLHGIRVISYLWVTLCHNYAITDPHVMFRGMKALDIIDGFGFTIIINGMLSVETFFIMSGFLVAFGILSEVKRKKSIWFLLPVTAVMRYIRLTVPGAFLVGVFFLYPLLVSGPLVDDVVQYLVNDVCRRNWWHVLLHVSNLRNPLDVCLPTLWYIACDYQLFLATLLFVFLLAKKPMAGVICLVAVALGACAAVGVQHYVNGFEPLPYTYISDLDFFFKGHGAMYLWPTGHLTSFVAGVLAAFCFHKYSHVRFGKVTYALCWTLSVVTALAVVYSVFDWNNRGSYVLAWASSYAGLHRLAWGPAVCWVVFVCATGQAALVNRLLSLDLFVPLSRLTYCGYLAQMLVISTRLVTQRHSVYYTHWLLVRDYLGHTVLIYMFAYLMYLLCECPTVKLSKVALNALTRAVSRGTRKDSKSSSTRNCGRL
ncbi:nose resistant to fluoxetine protein 6-like [Dermacentor variabilis]|uniref:nose resistant to fluoxetine protein 6-like n=1 Tax=Dermacentor variabilis TaxID=34621 RepID=UPI003F5B6DDE